MKLSDYTPLCDALVLLMSPLIEVVIHDRKSDKIVYINGCISRRKVSDASLLTDEDTIFNIDKIIYPKVNFDGRLVRSISVLLGDQWILCINCDVSIFQQMSDWSKNFLSHQNGHQPKSLFQNDWQEKIHVSMHGFLRDRKWDFDALNGRQKKEIVRHFYTSGAFREKNAATYIAKILSMGRATIFNYLKEWKTL